MCIIKIRQIIIFSLIISESAFGENFEQGLRNLTRHQAWMYVEIKVPLTGLFIASRAATEDKKKNATLAFSFSPQQNRHCQESMEIIFDVGSEQLENRNSEGLVELQVDSRPPLHLPGKIAASAGDHFVFFQIEQPNFVNELSKGKDLLINVRGIGLANFSLAGFTKTWKSAYNTCGRFGVHSETKHKNQDVVTPQKSAVSSDDVDRLTTYATILGRGLACGIDVKKPSSDVGYWIDSKFPPGSDNQITFLPIFMTGIEYAATQQRTGNSPDNCDQVRRAFSLMQWP